MAFGDRFKDWFGWGDDDTVYEDESSFDDDLWADLGIDPDSDPDTWFDETPTDDPYGIGSFFDDTYNFGDWGGDDDSWDPPTGTVNPWEDEAGLWDSDTGGFLRDLLGVKDPDADPYGIGSYFDAYDFPHSIYGDWGYDTPNIFDDEDWADTYDFGDWGDDTPTVDFEDPDFNWGEFDVDSYLDSLLDPDYGGGTEGDPSDWFINSGDPAYQDYSGVGGGMPPPTFDTSLLAELGYDPSTGSVEDWLQSIIPSTEVDQWEDLRDASGNIDPSLFTGPRESGILGGGIGPWLRDAFLGTGGLRGTGGTGGTGDTGGGGLGGLLGWLLKGRQGQTGGGGLFGGSGLETLLKLAAINKLRKQDSDDPADVVPIGADAFSAVGQGGEGSPIDYRVFNLQPALMPGVAYANVGKPEGMKGGGLGDVTLAKLEPGEFVVTKKAVDNIGAQNLYKMMKEAEGRG